MSVFSPHAEFLLEIGSNFVQKARQKKNLALFAGFFRLSPNQACLGEVTKGKSM